MFRTSLEGEEEDAYDQRDHSGSHAPRVVCMITGAKGVGKSTLLRYLTNRLVGRCSAGCESGYQHVAILDADVGQPELAPPGLLRLSIVKRPLLHPPYWNLVGNDEMKEKAENGEHVATTSSKSEVEVVTSIFFGAVASKADPTRYIAAVQMLMEEYERKVLPKNNIPLLINMDGWVKGLGYQILSSLILSLQPTHLCQILGETRAQTFDVVLPEQDENGGMSGAPKLYFMQACSAMPGVSLCSIPSVTWRNFRWAAYFLPPVGPRGSTGNGSNSICNPSRTDMMMDTLEGWNFLSAKDLQTGWISVPTTPTTGSKSDEKGEFVVDECRLACALAQERPYCVPMEAVECSLVGSDFQDLLMLNDRNERVLQALNGSIVSLCTNTATNECLGYGILRSIDWNRRLLYVLVPPTISPELLTRTTALIGGNIPLPLPFLFRGVYSESFPYLTTIDRNKNEGEVTNNIMGAEPMKSRNNIARRSLVKGLG
jgi:polynucleotide 5'-hydroxyl-kinase GRC3/NOL9